MNGTLTLHQGLTHALPDEVDFDPGTVERLNEHYAALVERGTIQGASYLLARHGKIIAHNALGKLTHKENSPDLTTNSIRKTYSVTKAVTAAAVMQLIDRGKLSLHQTASSLLAPFDVPAFKDITIFHLLTHTSGLRGDSGYFFEPYSLPHHEYWHREKLKRTGSSDWVEIVLSCAPENEPGKEFVYSTACYSVLGRIIELVSSKPYHEYIQTELLEPLGMDRSYFDVPEGLRGSVSLTSDWESEVLLSGRPEPDYPPKAGSGLYSTLMDLWRFGQMTLNGGSFEGETVLSRRAVQLMTQNHLSGVAMNGWGDKLAEYPFALGWSLYDFDLCTPGTYSHEGYGRSALYVDPAEQFIFVYFAPCRADFSAESVIMPKAIAWSGLL